MISEPQKATRGSPGGLSDPRTRRLIAIVASLNLGYFLVEFTVAYQIGSVALFADSIDFLEDGTLNLLVLAALVLALGVRLQAVIALGLAGLLLVPSLATLWSLYRSIMTGVPPEPVALGLTGLGALGVNVLAAFLIAQARSGSSMIRAAYLSARNDAIANIAIMGAGIATLVHASIWPDAVVGFGIALLNAGAAFEVYVKARRELSGTTEASDVRA